MQRHAGPLCISCGKIPVSTLLLLISFLTMLAPSPECSPGFKAGAPVLRDSEHGEKKVGMPVPKGPNTVQHLSTLYRHTQ